MTAPTSRRPIAEPSGGSSGRTIPGSSAVVNVAVQVAGIVPVRLDLAHVDTAEQQLGMSMGTVLVYLRRAGTARTIADGWSRAAVLARSLSPAITGRRPRIAGPSTVAVMVQMAGLPQVTAELEPARHDGAMPATVREPDFPVYGIPGSRRGHPGGSP